MSCCFAATMLKITAVWRLASNPAFPKNSAERDGMLLLQRSDIRKKIASICKYNEELLRSSIVAALKQIVLSDNLSDNNPDSSTISCDGMTLNPRLAQCTEIKIPKSGQLELKFVNKLSALDMLIQLMNQKDTDASPADFYSALSSSISSPVKDGDSDEI